MIHYCTYFDHNYVVRAIAMLDSLRRHSGPFTLWCLSLTPECEAILDLTRLSGHQANSA